MRNTIRETAKAMKESKKSGGVKKVEFSDAGVQYTYKDRTGYYFDKKKTSK